MLLPFFIAGMFAVIYLGLVVYKAIDIFFCKPTPADHSDSSSSRPRKRAAANPWTQLLESAKETGTRTLAGLAVMMTMLHLAMTQIVLSYFDCTELNGSDDRTLDADPSLFCGTELHKAHRAAAVLGVVFYVIGIPLTLLVVLVVVHYRLGYTYLSNHTLTSTFVKKYEKPFFIFEVSECVSGCWGHLVVCVGVMCVFCSSRVHRVR